MCGVCRPHPTENNAIYVRTRSPLPLLCISDEQIPEISRFLPRFDGIFSMANEYEPWRPYGEGYVEYRPCYRLRLLHASQLRSYT